MGFGKSFKKIAGGIGAWIANPTIAGGLMSTGMDYLSSQEAARESARARNQDVSMAVANAELQREFAKNGIRWRVEDAQAAGIHPLAALGASGASYNPVVMGSAPDYSRADFYSKAGQNISRAINATTTFEEKLFKRLQLKSLDLDNQLKQKQLLETGPNFPSASGDHYLGGQGDVGKGLGMDDGRVIDTPFRRYVSDPHNPAKEAGAIPDFQVGRTINVRGKGGYAVVPAADMKQRIEDSPMEYQWLMRNFFRFYRHPDGGYAVMNPLTGNLMKIPFSGQKKNRRSQ